MGESDRTLGMSNPAWPSRQTNDTCILLIAGDGRVLGGGGNLARVLGAADLLKTAVSLEALLGAECAAWVANQLGHAAPMISAAERPPTWAGFVECPDGQRRNLLVE